jgi:hypothetical protein
MHIPGHIQKLLLDKRDGCQPAQCVLIKEDTNCMTGPYRRVRNLFVIQIHCMFYHVADCYQIQQVYAANAQYILPNLKRLLGTLFFQVSYY